MYTYNFQAKIDDRESKIITVTWLFSRRAVLQRIWTSRALGHFPPKLKDPQFLYFITFDNGGTKEGRC